MRMHFGNPYTGKRKKNPLLDAYTFRNLQKKKRKEKTGNPTSDA